MYYTFHMYGGAEENDKLSGIELWAIGMGILLLAGIIAAIIAHFYYRS